MQPHETVPTKEREPALSLNEETAGTLSSDEGPGIGSALDHEPVPPLVKQSGHTPVHAQKNTGIRMLMTAVVLLLALGGGFLFVNHRRSVAESALRDEAAQAADAPMTVDVVKVQYGAGARLIPLPGECRAWYETPIYARVNGYVKEWFVDIGDHVKTGQVLATIETPELDQQLAANVAKVEACKAHVKLAEANVHFCEVTLVRYKDAPKGIVSDLERDEKEADYQTSLAKLNAAQSDLNSAQAEVDQLHAMIAFQKVIAPFNGIITQRRVDIGNLVTAGSTASTTPLFTLAQFDEMRVFVNVPETLAPDIQGDEQAIATADEFPGRQFLGQVARTSHAINNTAKTLRVEVDIPNKDATLLPGMFVRVNFEIKGQQSWLVIPASAINFRSGGPQVATVAQDGRVTFHDVSIARDLGDVIEIKGGLKPDDCVALNISYQVANGDVVKPNMVVLPNAPAAPVNSPAQADVPSGATKRVSLNVR